MLTKVGGRIACGLVFLFLPLALLAADLATVKSLTKAQRYGEALDELTAYTRAHGESAEILFLRGNLLMSLKRDNEARAVFESLIEQQPDLAEPYNNLALLYSRKGELKKARDLLTAALNADKHSATIYQNLNAVHAMMASRAYKKALEGETAPLPAPTSLKPLALLREQTTAPAESLALPPIEVVKESTQTLSKQAIEVVEKWAAAWSAQNVKEYLSFYGDSFRPAGGMKRNEWEQQRHDRLKRPRFINVKLRRPSVAIFENQTLAAVSFTQYYSSNTYKDVGYKVLILKRQNGTWRIIHEQGS